jgi:hypothetical protein
MKNQKLKLDELKVQSFVTSFDKEHDQTQELNGGYWQITIPITFTFAATVIASCSWCN